MSVILKLAGGKEKFTCRKSLIFLASENLKVFFKQISQANKQCSLLIQITCLFTIALSRYTRFKLPSEPQL